jgi:hypothetical protein
VGGRYLVTVRTQGDPLRTHDVEVEGRNTWHAGWLYRQINPGARVTAIRAVPEGR